MLAPAKYRTFASYLTGWLTSIAWVATVAIETLFAGTIIQGILILDYPSYDAKLWQGTLLTWLVIVVCIFINVVIPNWLPRIEVFILVFHLVGFVAIVATLWATTENYTPSHNVWAYAINGGEWPTQGLSYCVGFLGNVATFVGADASVHLAEEVSDAARNIPRAILGAMIINGLVGFVMMITVLYCLGSFDKVVGGDTGYPFIQVFVDSTKSVAGASVMAAVVLMLTWACATGIMTTASRMVWSFARDNGLPGSKFLSKVDNKTRIPVRAVFVVCAISAALTLIYVGSYVAFNDIVSLTITGFYGSYLLPASLLLYHRIKGNILPAGTRPEPQSTMGGVGNFKSDKQTHHLSPEDVDKLKHEGKATDSPPEYATPDVARGSVLNQIPLIWGPWHLPGILGIANNLYACCYMVFVIFWSVWPPEYHVTPSTMNYSILITGAVLIFSAIWYAVRARKTYRGPTVDEEVVAAVIRSGSVVSVS